MTGKLRIRWRRFKAAVDHAVFEYGPIVVLAAAVSAYLTWCGRWVP